MVTIINKRPYEPMMLNVNVRNCYNNVSIKMVLADQTIAPMVTIYKEEI